MTGLRRNDSGDEFAVLCSGTTGEQLTGSLDRLRKDFTASALSRAYPKLAWSAGIATFHPGSEETIDDLLRASDARMYSAKAEGKWCSRTLRSAARSGSLVRSASSLAGS